MTGTFSTLDWIIVSCYLLTLFGMGWFFASFKTANVKDYFLGSSNMPYLVVAFSVIATTQSAATFIGGPDQGYRGDFTYLAANIGAIIASLFIGKVLIPRFYALKATTVYELLDVRYGSGAMKSAGLMYLIGRLFASGARLYLAAIAISMILYGNISANSIISASFILVMLGFLITFLGGIRSIIWTDMFQLLMYSFSAAATLYFLCDAIPLNLGSVISTLEMTPDGENKLRLFNLDINFTDPYAMISIMVGMVLLYIASFGLDQDITQRLLTCKNGNEGAKALILSVIIGIPLIGLFISIGHMLYIFYDRPDIMSKSTTIISDSKQLRQDVNIFMYYILNELPSGLKGLVTVGVIAAAVSTINSGLNSMSSVIVQDFYRPFTMRTKIESDRHYVLAGQLSMAFVGLGLFAMSVLCFYWQRYSGLPLLDFALSVMVFAYSGLLGVYFTAIFTNRGSTRSVIWALVTGFLVTLTQQNYVVDLFSLPSQLKSLAFTWQLCIGTTAAFMVCLIGDTSASKARE